MMVAGAVWTMTRALDDWAAHVQFDAAGNLCICDEGIVRFRLTRQRARLLAERINRALDYWTNLSPKKRDFDRLKENCDG